MSEFILEKIINLRGTFERVIFSEEFVPVQTEKYTFDSGYINQNQTVFTIFQLIQNQTHFHLFLNQPENVKYNLISVDVTRIKSTFLSMCMNGYWLRLFYLNSFAPILHNMYDGIT